MKIKKRTRQDIIAQFEMEGINWSGRMSEGEFLDRLYDLKALPSTDQRFKEAAGDIWQHTENNRDWEGYWVFDDSRFQLKEGSDEVFLTFICEMAHPLVRENSDEAYRIVQIANDWMRGETWEIYESERRGDRPIFSFRMSENTPPPRYRVLSKLENQGGMGFVVFALDTETDLEVVLKSFKEDGDEEERKRFAREIRLLSKYKDSGFTIPILDFDIEAKLPFFVMPKAESDLTKYARQDLAQLEQIFYRMIDCVEHIHDNGDLHRDIKPENFLVMDEVIYVSDLGLAKDPTSSTQFTLSVHGRGTPVYAPPDFFAYGGFKSPEASDDVYSLAKSMLFLLTGIPSHFVLQGEVPTPIFEVIRRATLDRRVDRYQSCAEFRRDLNLAFDLVLKRVDGASKYFELKKGILRLKFDQIKEFMVLLDEKSPEEKERVYKENFSIIFQKIENSARLTEVMPLLLKNYKEIADYIFSQKFWPFQYAEKVADDARIVFDSPHTSDSDKADVLDIALEFATTMNRGAAGDTCARMIESIATDSLAMPSLIVINRYKSNFVFSHCVDVDNCRHSQISKAIEDKKAEEE